MKAPPSGRGPSRNPRKSEGKSLVGAFAVSIFVWAIDFKATSSQGAAGFQTLILIVYVILFVQITISGVRRGISIGPLWALILATVVFVTESSIVGLRLSQPPYAILVNLIPPLIYVSASSLTYVTLSASKDDLPWFLDVLRLACLAYAVMRILFVFFARGSINVADERWEILSGAVIPSLGIIAIALVQRLSKLDKLVLIFNLAVTIVSVTRTLFVALAAQIAAIFLARPSILFKSSAIKGLSLFGLSALFLLALDYGAGTGLANRWLERITVSQRVGADPTALTRSAETHFMLESFTTSAETIMFGNGMAAITSFTGPDAERAAKIVGWGSVNVHNIGYGHESYVSILFIGGLLGGGGLLIVQFLNGLQSIALIRRIQLEHSTYGDSAAHIGLWGAIIVIGMLATGFLSGTVADRDVCVWYGVGTGMLYWAREWGRELSDLPLVGQRRLSRKNVSANLKTNKD
jgi:hypothetical protein